LPVSRFIWRLQLRSVLIYCATFNYGCCNIHRFVLTHVISKTVVIPFIPQVEIMYAAGGVSRIAADESTQVDRERS
jgi:hypothetical protein